jgi:fatty-acid peroxygenase
MGDLALDLLRHGYIAVDRDRARRRGGDAYASRLLGHRAVVVRGPDGVAVFYDETLVARTGAVPVVLANLLFGPGAVHGLDGREHRERRGVFTAALEDRDRDRLVAEVAAEVEHAVASWGASPDGGTVVVHDALVEAYGRAVLRWSGVDVADEEAPRLAHELACIVDGLGGAGAAYPRAWRARRRTDRWARAQVVAVRDGRHAPQPGSWLARVAATDLDPRTAGVELLNVLRPTVAVAWLGAFAAVALDRDPSLRAHLATPRADEQHLAFAQEVRRTSPFVPVLAGRVTRSATVNGVEVRRGDRIVLDVWGTDTDDRLWEHGPHFVASRFAADPLSPPEHLVPQGGGPADGHRCPGEPLTVRMLAETVRVLAGTDVRLVGLGLVDPTRIPTLPDAGVRVSRNA